MDVLEKSSELLLEKEKVTREEFAQLLYRMQEFYGSSAASDDKAENKEEA